MRCKQVYQGGRITGQCTGHIEVIHENSYPMLACDFCYVIVADIWDGNMGRIFATLAGDKIAYLHMC